MYHTNRQNYQARGVPDVEIAPGGVYLTSKDGSFPLRGRHRERENDIYYPSDHRNSYSGPTTRGNSERLQYAGSVPFSPPDRRQSEPRFANGDNADPQSVNSKSGSSMGRRLLRSLNRKSSQPSMHPSDSNASIQSYDTDTSRRFKTGTPKMPEAMKKSFQQERERKIRAAFDKEHKKQLEWTGFNEHNANGSSRDISSDFSENANISGAVKNKRLSEQKLPVYVFLTTSCLLVVVAFARLFFARWHAYYYGFWSAVFPLLLGLAGLHHKAQYLSVPKNSLYICMGLLTTSVTMVTSHLSMKMIYNLFKYAVNLSDLNLIYNLFPFTYLSATDIGAADRGVNTLVYGTLALDCVTLALTTVNMYAMTSTLYCINNHWDATYTSTGTCDHRGTPNAFNPLQQISLGQALVFVGSLCFVVRENGENTYYSEMWTGVMVILASFISAFHLKRPDLQPLMIISVIGQLLALCCCAVSLTFISQSLVEDSDVIYSDKPTAHRRWQTLLSMLAAILYLLEVMSSVAFSAGVIYRAVKKNNAWLSEHPRIVMA